MWNQGGYPETSYGDQGGGYMNNSNFGSSQQTPTQNQKSRQRSQNIMPCTIAQIVNATQVDDKFTIDGVDLHQVTIIGLVRSAKESSTNLTYEIDDMTGQVLEVRQFVDNDESTPEAEKVSLVRENLYVRVHGHVRSFGGKRTMAAFRVLPLTDMNELTTHLLEVIYAHAYWTKKDPGHVKETSSTAANQFNNIMMSATTNTTNMRSTSTSATNMRAGTSSMSDVQVDVGLTTQQQQVLNVIRSCMDEQGLAISIICDRLKGMPLNVVKDAIEFLSSEGHIYSTIDDEHYKATDSM